MGWFGNRKVPHELPPWGLVSEDFLSDSIYNGYDPHVASYLDEVRKLIPEALNKKVLIGGGFAARLAGITNDHSDIDLFCLDAETFNTVTGSLYRRSDVCNRMGEDNLEVVESRGYGKVVKFKLGELKFDLVDTHEYIGNQPGIISLLQTFDINWAMAAISLMTDQIFIHKEALSPIPKVNPDRAEVCLEGTKDRLEKYANRLVREADWNEVRHLQQIIDKRIAKIEKDNRVSYY